MQNYVRTAYETACFSSFLPKDKTKKNFFYTLQNHETNSNSNVRKEWVYQRAVFFFFFKSLKTSIWGCYDTQCAITPKSLMTVKTAKVF